VTASRLRASSYSVAEGVTEGGAVDVTGPRGDLGGATPQKVFTVDGLRIQVTACRVRASSYSVTEGVTEGGAVDVTGPRGDLGGATLQKDVTVNRVWIPVTASRLPVRASSYSVAEGGQKVLLKM